MRFLPWRSSPPCVSPSPNIGFFGLYLWGTGWLFWLGAAGAFAIGASLRTSDRKWLFAGLVVGALGNALIAIFQIVSNAQSGGLALFDGTQADGALGNPIHLEALLLGALALILGRTCRNPLRWGAVGPGPDDRTRVHFRTVRSRDPHLLVVYALSLVWASGAVEPLLCWSPLATRSPF